MESNDVQEPLKTGGFLYVIYIDLILSVLAYIVSVARAIGIIKTNGLTEIREQFGFVIAVNLVLIILGGIFLFLLTLYVLLIMTDYQKRSISLLKLNYSVILVLNIVASVNLINHELITIISSDYFAVVMKLVFLIYIFRSERVKETFVKEI